MRSGAFSAITIFLTYLLVFHQVSSIILEYQLEVNLFRFCRPGGDPESMKGLSPANRLASNQADEEQKR
jgi:hypothetical protein